MAILIDPQASLTLGQAVGNILSALVDAQARAARATVEFIDEVGFQPAEKEGGPPSLRVVEFTYRKRDENDNEASFRVGLPLLGMVDIPLIAIKRAKIDLEFQVSTVQEPAETDSRPMLPGRAVPVIRGQLLTGRRSTDERGSIKVSVEVEKADLPPALARSLDILEVAASEHKLAGPGD
ncbi:DUF2589 domain-containing protein [Cellulomonas sp. Leaf334]|uniref:DUF2589 domain-containing protein n=1 Tax=Cellulomonas sp. Leaf334 TaxID=1736339 RepID=UPI000701B8F4|nr:DUF2589 domain-containing protein [Cellulomonas sp. Leaf334]KQR16016.1 hypothetical protein ASF78_00805 [Cellulomonas sp. Leaf334]